MHNLGEEALRCHPYGLCAIIRSLQDPALQDPTTAEYVQEPLAPGTTCINILLTNLSNSVTDPTSITFEDAAVSWYHNLLLHRRSATDTTGVENKIFLAFGVTPPPCPP